MYFESKGYESFDVIIATLFTTNLQARVAYVYAGFFVYSPRDIMNSSTTICNIGLRACLQPYFSEENKKSRRRSACIDLRARNTKKSANMHSKVACATG